ncbi:alpha-hydroxy-acid oxidizing protein [Parahaliea sp. F7430]|uniref:Alpha-hydroxy-acid oxidizing protein n=1 Tax=Sediminihaliea albiluteola TaxID=2758564 RepID=A0A7W2TTJ9_9GAMM|nr:alpha-hydroxy acid oxidase [Sediminihaliea albiluteola]MBA6411729.1 alpha-hydroxy-acid oxidizing protein [Sediminihaliea albiluteola]
MAADASLNAIPDGILAAAEYENHAANHLADSTLAWLRGGSGNEYTLRANQQAFQSLNIRPQLLNNFSQASTRLKLCGTKLESPMLLAPVGHQHLLHKEGELAVTRAAEVSATCLVASTMSSLTLEVIAEASNSAKWFQLYWQPRREDTLDLIRRAEGAAYEALVLTLDTPLQVLSHRAQRAGFAQLKSTTPANLKDYKPLPQRALAPNQSILLHGMMSEAPDWEDLAWLLETTTLPVIVKGVAHPDDAFRLQSMGVAGQIVSNHGGRSLDGMPASLHLLPAIRDVLGAHYPLLLDGGIRSGTDIFKAIASGADAVLIGRLQAYALAVAGALGVAHMLKLLRDELELCMALAGTPTLNDIGPQCLMGAI